MRIDRLLVACLLTAFASASVAAPAAKPQAWTLVDVTLPGALGTNGKAINNHGEIAGEMLVRTPGGSATHAFVWKDGVATDLGPAPDANPIVASMQVSDINDRGDVSVTGSTSGTVPYVWKDGAWITLPFNGSVTGINRNDDASGVYLPTGSRFPRGLAVVNGAVSDVGTLGGSSAVAWRINNHQAVVGSSSVMGDGAAHAFMYKDGVISDLGILPDGHNSEARDVNDHGVAVGTCDLPNQNFRTVACVFEAGKPARMLFDVPGLHEATGINNRGDVVGNFFNGKSFLYQDGRLTQLEDLDAVKAAGFVSLAPVDVNDHGWITGTARKADGYPHAFVLIPR